MTLQLFEKGLKNKISLIHRYDSSSSNAEGGCSNHRTAERQKEASFLLQQLHPKTVKVVQKTTKES